MENFKECPVCGSKEIRQGKQVGAAIMFPIKSMLSTLLKGDSDIIAIICSDCGYTLSIKIENTQKFK